MTSPRVTVIVTQRERFSLSQLSLDSILADYPSYPFNLIYVDGNSPASVQTYLQAQAAQYDFMTVVRRDTYLRSNTARNIAIPLAEGADYIAFVDNDVIVESGWLKRLVACAEQVQAGIVAPLVLQGQPGDPEIEVHVAGIHTKFRKRKGERRWFEQKQLFYAKKLKDVEADLPRGEIDSFEFHCLLVKREVLDRTGPLDEIFDSLASHTDLCHQAQACGYKTVVEPDARVVFLNPRQITTFTADDVPFYFFKWSEPSIRAVFKRCVQKWNLASDDPSFWAIWRWVIENRQLPATWSTDVGSRDRKRLEFCRHRRCPGWLRTYLEMQVIRRCFPPEGLPETLNPAVPASLEGIANYIEQLRQQADAADRLTEIKP